jgi:hypothetical protein
MHRQASAFSSIPALTNKGQAVRESRMRAVEIFPHRDVQRSGCGLFHLAGVGLTIIALLISECLPITAMVPHHQTAAGSTVADEPPPIPATTKAVRLAGEAVNRLPLRFEAAANGVPGRFLARTSHCNIHFTATEAGLEWRTAAGAGRLGCGADLGSPRNAGSLHANEQLPGPRRDRAAPRRQPLGDQ